MAKKQLEKAAVNGESFPSESFPEEVAPLAGHLAPAEGGRGSADEGELHAKLQATEADKAALEKQLAATKVQLKQVREERCLDALQAVLVAHRCQLLALPNGQFQVLTAIE